MSGQYYLISDYKTCYDRPNYNQFKNPIAVSIDSYIEGNVIPIIVLAISNNALAVDAYQPAYPNDNIKYDINYTVTESGNPAFGRITERIDQYGNRADYDHIDIQFIRYNLYNYNKLNPLQGTVELQGDGTVLGVNTLFTNLVPGNIIAILSTNETFYEVISVLDDTTMTVRGNSITATGTGGYSFYIAYSSTYDSYYPNNIEDPLEAFNLYNTFDASSEYGGDGCINTYIGDHAKYFINEGIGDFLLANNVLKDGRYENNTIGDSSYNNTFNDDCTANQIGYAFRNNITDDDFDNNVIGDFFENNIITAEFEDNHIGNSFRNNVIINNNFYRNQIGNDFRDNWLDSDWGFDFQNNQIGNQFNNNVIYKEFYKNVILNGYNENQTWDAVYGNKIGNGFNNNEIYNEFYDNHILDYFNNNTIGSSEFIGTYNFYDNIIGNDFKGNFTLGNFFKNYIGHDFVSNNTDTEFRDNLIGNNFFSNNIDINFGYNTIGSGFSGNTIANDFGYGGSQARGNKIGNECYDNNIGEYFYDNIIADGFYNNNIIDYCFNNKFDGIFSSNQIGVGFQNNDIKINGLVGTDFKAAQGNIDTISTNTPNGTDNTYNALTVDESNSIYGLGATFDVTVSGSVVISVLINSPGTLYEVGDQLVIYGSQFGGTNGVDDLFIDVTGLLTFPYVYKKLNCTIFIDEAGVNQLSFIDSSGVLIVTTVTPP